MKHYPIVVAGIKATACVITGWNWATISIKFSHRKGQNITISHNGGNNVWIDEYPTYTAIRFQVTQHSYADERHAIKCCAECIKSVSYHINFDADMSLVTKELLTILG